MTPSTLLLCSLALCLKVTIQYLQSDGTPFCYLDSSSEAPCEPIPVPLLHFQEPPANTSEAYLQISVQVLVHLRSHPMSLITHQ